MKRFAVFICSVLLPFGCGRDTGPSAPAGALAKVGDVYITQEDFERRLEDLDIDFSNYVRTPYGKTNFLSMLINEELLRREANLEKIDQTSQYQNEVAAFKEAQSLALKEFERNLARNTLLEKLRNEGILSVSEEEIKAYYKKYPYQIYMRHILTGEADSAARLTRELKGVGQQEFSERARRASVDPTVKKNGGMLPAFIPGEYIGVLEVAAANTPVGQTQGFFETSQGFHIIMKTKEEQLSYKDARDRIEKILEKQKIDAYLDSLRKKFGAEIINDNE